MDNKNTFTLSIPLDEINTILAALGERPYVQVFEAGRKSEAESTEKDQVLPAMIRKLKQ